MAWFIGYLAGTIAVTGTVVGLAAWHTRQRRRDYQAFQEEIKRRFKELD